MHGDSQQQVQERLSLVFQLLEQAGVKLKPSKCKMYQKKICYLGHIISEAGIEADPSLTNTVKNWKEPTYLKTLQQFVGFVNFFRKFIKDYAMLTLPLTKLLAHNKLRHKRRKKDMPPPPWNWGQEQQMVFETLKDKLTTTPVLTFPDYAKQFIL